jgi:hypothetical protein
MLRQTFQSLLDCDFWIFFRNRIREANDPPSDLRLGRDGHKVPGGSLQRHAQPRMLDRHPRLHAFNVLNLIFQLFEIVVFLHECEHAPHITQLTKLHQTNSIVALDHAPLVIQHFLNTLFDRLDTRSQFSLDIDQKDKVSQSVLETPQHFLKLLLQILICNNLQ